MRHIYTLLFFLTLPLILIGQSFHGSTASNIIDGAEMVNYQAAHPNPTYVKLSSGHEIPFDDLDSWFSNAFKTNEDLGIIELNRYRDGNGDIHVRFNQTKEGMPVFHAMFIIHMNANEQIYAVNGLIFREIELTHDQSINEAEALTYALQHVNADVYKWELEEEEKHIKHFTENDKATHYPKAEKVIMKHNDSESFSISYSFNIYAHQPMSRSQVYVDANSGRIINVIDLIHETDVPGTAITKYSGTKTIITDSTATTFRLRETGRGNGIETYDMHQTTTYGAAVDFTDADNYWDNVNVAQDEVATDAHWGAEMTYDYFYNIHQRNSIDDQGFKLVSYVHYDQAYANAFWNGQYMTYGDGNGTWGPLTALDICGHEVSHGLTSNTANLIYSYESGALNESFSDIFGTAIEFYAKPFTANWLMGENIGSALRSMSNPNAYGDPDTYLGTNYYIGSNDNGGVHTNSGVLNYWFYLLSDGGSGTNDIGNAFSVNGIGIINAAKIAYRMLTVYLVNTSQYADARFYAILSAADLFGPCSNQMIAATNAMYAVGIGSPYSAGVLSDFTLNIDSFCSPPAQVQFSNNSINGFSFSWEFGDGGTSTALNPNHTYTNYGDYDVKLIADGGLCGIDSVTKVAVVSIDSLYPCFTSFPQSGLITYTTCTGKLFDSGGPNDYQNNINSVVSLQPPGAAYVTLDFQSFDFESGYDFLIIYDGPDIYSPVIGIYDGSSLPNGGIINSTASSITLQQTTDQGVVASGFELDWYCHMPTTPPIANFYTYDTLSCTGFVEFFEASSNGAYDFEWDFGDGNTSITKDPVHQYANDGVYTVSMIATNLIGSDTVLKTAYVEVQRPSKPKTEDGMVCQSGSATLSAFVLNGQIEWYDNIPALGGNLLDTGTVFTTPVVTQTTEYYAQSIIPGVIQTTGKNTNSGNGGYFSSSPVHYLVFDVFEPLTIVSVVVYAQDAGNRTIRLRDSGGNTLISKTVNLVIGQQTVQLDFDVQPGVDYQLAGPGSPGLYRNNGGVNYPYEIPGMVSIHRSSAGSDPFGYYYFFYDWKVRGEGCISNIDTVKVHVSSEIPDALFNHNVNGNMVSFTNSSINGIEYEWDFDDGNISALQDPSNTYTFDGSYDVKLIAKNGCGVDSVTHPVNIATSINELTNDIQIDLYPNPTTDELNLVIDSRKSMDISYSIVDVLGRVVFDHQKTLHIGMNHISLSTSDLRSGVYFIKVQNMEGIISKRFIRK